MSKKPLVSILTPVFNSREYIGQTIRSVTAQSYRRWEWILLDDGSTDGTGDILKALKDSRIHYVRQEHSGIARITETYNKCLGLSSGELVAMLDHDDYWPEDRLEKQVKSFDDPEIVLSYGECRVVNQKGEGIDYMGLPNEPSVASNYPVGSALKVLLMERYCFIHNITVMLRKDVLSRIGGFVEAKGLFHDFPTWTRISLEGRFSAIPYRLGYWRRHASSTNLSRSPERMFLDGIDFLREFASRYDARLKEIGFPYDINDLERHWEEMGRRHLHYIPYNKAMLLLRLNAFREAKEEFEKFLRTERSMKNRFIYILITFSALTGTDLVTPLISLKENWHRAHADVN